MTVANDRRPAAHAPSAPPDPKALFSRLAAFSARHRRAVIITWLLIAFAAAPLAMTLTGALSGAGWEAQGSTAQQVRDELRRDFPQLGAEDPVVVYHQQAPIATNPAGLTALVADLQHAPHTKAVANPLTLPASAGLISPRRAHRDRSRRAGREERRGPARRGRRSSAATSTSSRSRPARQRR